MKNPKTVIKTKSVTSLKEYKYNSAVESIKIDVQKEPDPKANEKLITVP